MSQLPVTLFHRLDSRPDDARYMAYQPASWPLPGRYARYGLNLVLLAATYGDEVAGTALFPDSTDVAADWRSHVRLWQSTLTDEEWAAVLGTVDVEHRWESGSRQVGLQIAWEDQSAGRSVDLSTCTGPTTSQPSRAVQTGQAGQAGGT